MSLMTPREVADALNVSDSYVRQLAPELGGVRIGRLWRFPADRIAQVAERGTIPTPWQEAEYPASPSPNDPPKAVDTASAGASTATAAKNEGTPARRTRRTRPRASASAFARDFPEYVNASQSGISSGSGGIGTSRQRRPA